MLQGEYFFVLIRFMGTDNVLHRPPRREGGRGGPSRGRGGGGRGGRGGRGGNERPAKTAEDLDAEMEVSCSRYLCICNVVN